VIEFRALGSFEVVEGDRPLALGSPQQRALLAVLLLHRQEVVSCDRLVDALWGERAPVSAVKIVQGYVSNLRKVLGDGLLITHGHDYVLQTQPCQIDVDRFESLVAEGRRALQEGDARSAAARLLEGLALWRGPPLADFTYEPFAQSEIARLEEARVGALEDRIDAELTLGDHRGLVGELEGLVAAHPHRERLLGQLMLCLYRCGRQADALEAYRRGHRALGDELGLEPGPELRVLEQRILTHDPALDAPEPTAAAARDAERRQARLGSRALAVGGVLLFAAVLAAVIVELAGGGSVAVRVSPNSVAAIDTRSDRVVGQVAVGARPSAIAFGSGSLWVANLDDETVSRVNPTTLRTLRTLSVRDRPTGIAAAGARVWIVGPSPTATFVSVTRVDPQFDTLDRSVRIGNVVPGSPAAIAARAGALWVAPYAGDLTRLDPETLRVMRQVDPNGGPAGLDLGAGAMWVTDSFADDVTRVDPTGLLTPIAVGNGASAIAVGDGGVWVADTGDDAVVRIDPVTQAVTATIAVGDAPAGISVGGGSVWVANSGDGTVTRIDPKTDQAIATIAVGGSPQEITVAGGRAWVTVDAPTIPTTRLTAGDGTARLDSRFDVDYLDPALAYEPESAQLLYATCAKLLNYPDRAGLAGSQLVPEVARSLPTRSADGKTYTFAIRTGYRFSPPSDEPVTAETFKETIERTLSPAMNSPAASQFSDIVGASAYMARKAPHISGVIARGNTLTIHLTAPAPDFPSRIAEPFFCAVPADTPVDPNGRRDIPSAGPYQVASYTPGQGIVLTRNPNYHGSRPHRLARIELDVTVSPQRAITQVKAGRADYAVDGEVTAASAASLASLYGPGSPAAKRGHQQYFVTPTEDSDYLALNTHRPLFANARLRQAVNYAINRAALARLGDGYSPLPEPATDNYLPPGIPGYSDRRIYPLTPNLAKARELAKGQPHRTAVFYTCPRPVCAEQAQIIKTDLAAIGIGLRVKAFQGTIRHVKFATPGEPFDIGYVGWNADYPDPDNFLNLQLENPTILPPLDNPAYRAQLAAAARLSGAQRYLTYARLNASLIRNAAPFVAYGNPATHELFSARMSCQTYGFYGLDLAALCIKQKPAKHRRP
jgi:YVTN family beta-propeller protein